VARLLTPEQAARAIYFDFESCVDEAPSLLGWSFELEDGTEQFSQWIVEGALQSATRTVPHTDGAVRCGRSTLDEAVAHLVTFAEAYDRQIVSWARFDLNVIESNVDDRALFERARVRFMNALPTVRKWQRDVHPDEILERTWGGKNKLSVYCELMDIYVPEKYGQNVAAKGIRAMREAIETYGSYSAIPTEGKAAKEAWKAVLGHNRLDCKNAREVVIRAAAECAAT
jgi:hypothetical protein